MRDKTRDAQVKYMVSRFLMWRLPENFNPDGGISFKPIFNEHTAYPMKHEPVGTNLLDATQAEAMIRYLIDGMPEGASQAEAPLIYDGGCASHGKFNSSCELCREVRRQEQEGCTYDTYDGGNLVRVAAEAPSPTIKHCDECSDSDSYTDGVMSCDGTSKFCVCHGSAAEAPKPDPVRDWLQSQPGTLKVYQREPVYIPEGMTFYPEREVVRLIKKYADERLSAAPSDARKIAEEINAWDEADTWRGEEEFIAGVEAILAKYLRAAPSVTDEQLEKKAADFAMNFYHLDPLSPIRRDAGKFAAAFYKHMLTHKEE